MARKDYTSMLTPSPVEEVSKTLPQGNGDFPGSDVVWARLNVAAHYLALSAYLGFDHVKTMAVMGCGHEEIMKYWVSVCMANGWVHPGDEKDRDAYGRARINIDKKLRNVGNKIQ